MAKMKYALVCGAGGFIGSHLVRKLHSEGFLVRGVDLKRPQFSDTVADEFLLGDLRDPSFCEQAFTLPGGNRFDEVYQLAADMGGAGYVFTGDNDADIVHNSVQINLNVLRCCVDADAGRVLYASSACVYPQESQQDPNNPQCSEDSVYPAHPDSEYGWEKLFSERMYFNYARNKGLSVRIARFHNIFGAEGTWAGGREKVPAAICRKVATAVEGEEIEVWGDGEQTRSFLHVDDCLEAMVRLMRGDWPGPVNIGSEEMVSINQLAAMVQDIAGKSLAIKHIPNGPQGVRGRTSDNRLMEERLGWKPAMDLRQGLERTYPWVESQTKQPERALIYAVGPFIGLGHILLGISCFYQYAQATGRTFYLTFQRSAMALKNDADIDGTLTELFDITDLEARGIVLSERQTLERVDAQPSILQETRILARKPGQKQTVMACFESLRPYRGDLKLSLMDEVTSHMQSNTDFDESLLLVNAMLPDLSRFDWESVEPLFHFSPSAAAVLGVEDDYKQYVGVHLRHGNGEDLMGRLEGEQSSYDTYLQKVAERVNSVSQALGAKALVFSDNSSVVSQMVAKTNGRSLGESQLIDKPHQTINELETQEARRQAIFKVFADFYCLSQCSSVVCGRSMFTRAAQVYSDSHEFHTISQAELQKKNRWRKKKQGKTESRD